MPQHRLDDPVLPELDIRAAGPEENQQRLVDSSEVEFGAAAGSDPKN
jgi:hypothetical protein